MTPLQSRKQILIAESELNRAHLVQDWRTLAEEFQALATEVRTVRSFASAATTLVAGVAAFWRKKSPPPEAKPLWWQTMIKSAGTISSLWEAFRARRSDPAPSDRQP